MRRPRRLPDKPICPRAAVSRVLAAGSRRCFLCLVALTIIPGCMRPNGPDGKTKLVFASCGNLAEFEVLAGIVHEFEKVNPDIEVEFVPIAGSNYDTVLLTMIAGGAAPDLFNAQPYSLGSMTSKGVLLPLDSYLPASRIRIGDLYPQTVQPYRWDGEQFGRGPLYGLCKDWSPDCLIYYNQNLFDEAGIPYPDGSWDRAKFVEIAKKLTKRDARGRVTQFGLYNNCCPEQWAAQSGGQVFSEDGTQCLVDSPAYLQGVRFANDLANRWRVSPGLAEQQQGGADSLFQTGRVAMCFYGQWMAMTFAKQIKSFRWSVTVPPHDVQDVYISNGMVGYGIYARSPHPKETMRLLEFLMDKKGQAKMARLGWNIPSDRKVAESDAFLNNPVTSTSVTKVFVDASKKTRLFARSPYITPMEFDQYFSAQWELMMLGKKTPERAMQDAAAQIDQAIRDNMAILGKEPPR